MIEGHIAFCKIASCNYLKLHIFLAQLTMFYNFPGVILEDERAIKLINISRLLLKSKTKLLDGTSIYLVQLFLMG